MKATPKSQSIVLDLEEELIRALELHAARHGRSVEEEHREILRKALLPPKRTRSFKDHLLAMPPVGEDSDFERD